MPDFDIAVIGAGTGGLTVARLTAKAGKRVALVERARPGGDCLWTGCVPTKALLASARRYHEARHSAAFGVVANDVRLDFAAVRAHLLQSQERAGRVDSPGAIRADGIHLLEGDASFIDGTTLDVAGRPVTASHIVIACGVEPAIPSIPGLRESQPATNVDLLAWESLPASVAIIGGGPIGMEFAQALTRFGVRVTVLEASDRILTVEDPSASAVIADVLEREGVTIRTSVRIARVDRSSDGYQVRLADGEVVECERLVVAAGRKPSLDALRLDRAGIATTKSGITLDASLRTTQPHIFAVGDIAGGPQFTHVAEAQGRLVANILTGGRITRRFQRWSDRVVPRVTYTDPEVASVGLGESEARNRYRGVKVWTVPLTEVDRAIVEGATDGFITIVTAPGWTRFVPGLGKMAGHEIVGATLVGPHAGDLLMPIVNMMKLRLPVGLLAWNMQAYPTLALGVRQAAGLPFS